jgi:hypothetical protein
MTRLAQAVHVAVKDVRLAGYWLVAWAALLGFALLSALRLAPDPAGGALVTAVLVVVGAIVLAAVLVQQDAPLEPDAFWATRPLAPSAVWLAKLLAVVVLVMLPTLAGQAMVLALHDADVATHLRILLASVALLLFWVAAGMVVAAATRSMRHFVLAMLAIAIGASLLLAALPARMGAGLLSSAQPALGMLLPLLLLGIAALHYHVRRRTHRGPALLAAGAIVALWLGLLPSAERWTASPDVRADALTLPAAIASVGDLHGGVQQHVLRVELPAPAPDQRHVIVPTHAYIQRADGRRDVVGLVQRQGIMVAVPAAGAAIVEPTLAGDLAVNLDERAMQQLRSGDGRLVVLAELHLQQVSEFPPLPLTAGSTAAAHGARARIARWDPAHAAGDVVISEVSRPSMWRSPGRFEMAVATGAGEVPLHAQAASGSPNGMVVPSSTAWMTTFSIQPIATVGSGETAVDPADLPPDATLRIRTWRQLQRHPAVIHVPTIS